MANNQSVSPKFNKNINIRGCEIAKSDAERPIKKILQTSGELLKKSRESKEEKIHQVADILCIGRHYLQAVEDMNKDSLPEQVYTLGFVRSYANYLGLDPQKTVNKFKIEMFGASLDEDLVLPEPIENSTLPAIKLVLSCLGILLIVICVGNYIYSSKPKTSENIIITQDNKNY